MFIDTMFASADHYDRMGWKRAGGKPPKIFLILKTRLHPHALSPSYKIMTLQIVRSE